MDFRHPDFFLQLQDVVLEIISLERGPTIAIIFNPNKFISYDDNLLK
jgi:hypothetical protein